MYDVSIIIVSYNTKKLTLDTINSVLKEKSKFEKEIIVVDNNSKDGSLELLQRLQLKKVIRLIANKENFGFAKANNQAMDIAKGRHVLLLNSDTIVLESAIGDLVKFADSHKDAGVVGARLYNADGSVQGSCGHFPTIKNAVKEYWFGKKGLFEKYAPVGESAVEVESIVGAAFLITANAIKKVGKLDERYFFYFEDIAYCRSVRRAGLKVYYYPKAKIIHYHGASGKKIADPENQWRRLIPSSIIYHGYLKHNMLMLILWIGQKWQKLFN